MKRQHAAPKPIVQSLLICREVFRDRAGEFTLVGPTTHFAVAQFPCRLGVVGHLQVVEAHGEYLFSACLKDSGDEVVWRWRAAMPMRHPQPLVCHHVVFHEWAFTVPRPGRYYLELYANGEELVSQSLMIGPAELFIG